MASVVAYCLFCMVFGWGSLLESPDFIFRNPLELGPYLVLAFVVAGSGVFFIKLFHASTRFFHGLNIPNYLKPAIAGFLPASSDFFLPHTLAFGYGYAQKALTQEVALAFLLSLAIGKMFTTSFSHRLRRQRRPFRPIHRHRVRLWGVRWASCFTRLLPGVVGSPGPSWSWGWPAFFAAVSNTPISTIIFVSEMTNSSPLVAAKPPWYVP